MKKTRRERLNEVIEYAGKRGIAIPPDVLLDIARQDAKAEIEAIEIPPESLPIYTMTKRGAVPPPRKDGLVLGSKGWEKPATTQAIVGGGVSRHHYLLTDLDYASAAHTGFQPTITAGAAVADATGAGDVVAQLNTLLARLRAMGLIET